MNLQFLESFEDGFEYTGEYIVNADDNMIDKFQGDLESRRKY